MHYIDIKKSWKQKEMYRHYIITELVFNITKLRIIQTCKGQANIRFSNYRLDYVFVVLIGISVKSSVKTVIYA